jgi:hypothetical protein
MYTNKQRAEQKTGSATRKPDRQDRLPAYVSTIQPLLRRAMNEPGLRQLQAVSRKREVCACDSALSIAGKPPAIARQGAQTAPHASKPRWRAVRAALPCVWLVQPSFTWSEKIRRTQDRQIKPTCSQPKRRSHLQIVHLRGLEKSTTRKMIFDMRTSSAIMELTQRFSKEKEWDGCLDKYWELNVFYRQLSLLLFYRS